MILKVPFIKHFIGLELIKRREIEFIVGLGALEMTCKTFNKKLFELSEFTMDAGNNYDFLVVLLHSSYVVACQQRYKRPKYTEDHARMWLENMGDAERLLYTDAIKELTGTIAGTIDEEKKT